MLHEMTAVRPVPKRCDDAMIRRERDSRPQSATGDGKRIDAMNASVRSNGMRSNSGEMAAIDSGGHAAAVGLVDVQQCIRVEADHLLPHPVVDVLHGFHDRRQLVDGEHPGRLLYVAKRAITFRHGAH